MRWGEWPDLYPWSVRGRADDDGEDPLHSASPLFPPCTMNQFIILFD